MSDRSPDALVIREMRPDEAPAVGRLSLASYDAYGRFEGPYRDYLADPTRRRDDATALLVADHEGQLVGTVTFVLPSDRAWEGPVEPTGDAAFRVLAVAPEAEGRGVGRRLVEECIARARDQGCHRIVISSMTWMTRAHQLYEGLGFRRRPDLDVRFPGGIGVFFTLDLTDEAPSRFPPPGPIPEEPPSWEAAWQLDDLRG